MHPRFRDRLAPTTGLSTSQLGSFPAAKLWRVWTFTVGLAASSLSSVLLLTAQAQNPASSAPAQLTTLLTQMDAATNARNLKP